MLTTKDKLILAAQMGGQPQSVGTIRHQGQWVLLANGKPLLTIPSFAEALAAIQELPL